LSLYERFCAGSRRLKGTRAVRAFTSGADHGLRWLSFGGVELVEEVAVVAQACLRRVTGLPRDLEDRLALVDEERDERVAQVVCARRRQPHRELGVPERTLGPAVPLALGEGAVRRVAREHNALRSGAAAGEPPLGEVLGERCEQPDGALGAGLGLFQSAHRACAGHCDGALTDAVPGQRQGLARSQSGVGKHGHERRAAQSAVGEEVLPEQLDLGWSDRTIRSTRAAVGRDAGGR
jgi:hypothetical protein